MELADIPSIPHPAEIGAEAAADALEGHAAPEILGWAVDRFDDVVATSSFQTQSMPLLHLLGRLGADFPVVFLDTGFHFPETLSFRDRVAEEFDLTVRSVTNELGHEEFRRKHGALYRRDPDMCCYLNKVEPLERVLEPADAWIAGVRRDQTDNRADTPVVAESSKGNGTYKICPMVEWTGDDVDDYIDDHDLPEHPLTSEGYTSIGCAPCTACPSNTDEDDERAGRWAGRDKEECGLHLDDPSDESDLEGR